MGVTNIIPDELQKVAARYFGEAYQIVVAVHDNIETITAVGEQVDAFVSLFDNMDQLLNIYENMNMLGEAGVYISTVNTLVSAAQEAADDSRIAADESAASRDVANTAKNVVLTSQQTVQGMLGEVQATADIVSSIVSAVPYVETDPYQYPDVVIGSNGFSYRCTNGTPVTGVDPVGDITGTWIQLNGLIANPNLLINSEFYINTEGYAADGVAELTHGKYGHDMWKVEGGTLIYTKNVGSSITINSIEGTTGAEVIFSQKNDKMIRFAGEPAVLSVVVTNANAGGSMTLFADGASLQITGPGVYTLKYTISTGKIGLKATIPATGLYSKSFAFEQLKVELGSTYTAWKAQSYDDVKRYCQKYHLVMSTVDEQAFLGFGGGNLVLLPTPEEMNTVHTVLFNDLELLNLTTAAQPLLSMSAGKVLPNGVMLNCTVAEPTRGPSILQSRYPDGMITLDARY